MDARRVVNALVAISLASVAATAATLLTMALARQLLGGDAIAPRPLVAAVGYVTWVAVALGISAAWHRSGRRLW